MARLDRAERRVEPRSMAEVETPYGRVHGKLSGQGVFAPEYDDCKLIAQRTGTPLQLVFAIAQESYFKNPK